MIAPIARRHPAVWRIALLALALVLVCASPARADRVTVNGIPVPGVEVLTIRDGRLVYLTDAGLELESPMGRVESLELDRHPAYAQAVALLEAGDTEQAVALLNPLLREVPASEAWLRQLVTRSLVEAYDAAGLGYNAAARYVDLVNLKADPFFLENPPLGSVGRLDGDERGRAVALVERALRGPDDLARPALEALLDRARHGTPAPPQAVTPPTAPAPAADPQPAARPEPSAVVLPASIAESSDPVVELLRRGRYADALAAVDARADRDRGRLQQRLYLRGLALLGLADASGRREDYLDAGIAFMRVTTVAGPVSSYLGPALLESAYVHQKIGVPDVAAALLDEADPLIDAQDEPSYRQRYQRLRGP